ncbi:bifunctional metallophosphatase/5'-nucleotidase [Lutibacter sp. A80]|uniref:bifunctional metallophosphatase/5'-nucleotidase n=1 Tax=Lutibacter sp. A80 TaxID=2918453 RepID=UPI001F050F18|nr:bifunctional UDP-sugar hydrolase/5'-nucleotidase [Lutibacter sp. A80]UMB60695.1 bifunctional metallophosphatase/5'-nucleotidase [Lutibacter sp. A80]
MKYIFKYALITITTIFIISSCSKKHNTKITTSESSLKKLTIFHINDQHGQLTNFAKIKDIVTKAKKETNVLLVCSGDIFSGNPVVDNHPEKGFPMIDLMNKTGFDISVIGNHEFDYGESILKDRFNQSQFEWICANVTMDNSEIPQPNAYKTILINDLKVTFLGLVETNGKEDDIIPSTHPWRVQNLTFEKYQNVISNYAQLKETEDSDLYVALTHLGKSSDYNIANNYPYFDLIIGGHSHSKLETEINNIPIYQAGANLSYLGKIELEIENKAIKNTTYTLIELDTYQDYDSSIKEIIDTYNVNANLDEVIGFSEAYHNNSSVGSFYTDALRIQMGVDITFQNTGGIRNSLNEGDILKNEIYSIDPFNNGSVTYTMSISEIKNFLKNSKAAIYYSGVYITQEDNTIIIKNKEYQTLSDNELVTIGLNDYIPAVYDTYFTKQPIYLPNTTAETLINFLESTTTPINYTQVNSYFKYE